MYCVVTCIAVNCITPPFSTPQNACIEALITNMMVIEIEAAGGFRSGHENGASWD
jgi:hypothetical protein